jgi:hypothetical protein
MTTANVEVCTRNTGCEKPIGLMVVDNIPGTQIQELELPDGVKIEAVHGPDVEDPLTITADGKEVWIIPPRVKTINFHKHGAVIFEIDHT